MGHTKISVINFSNILICSFAFLFLLLKTNSAQELNMRKVMRNNLPAVNLEKSFSAPGYCESFGGSVTFERITSVHVVERPGNRLDITVNVFISNPTGCVSGEPCGVYDSSPEYVNVWIDWDGDMKWEPHELVLNDDLTGYKSIGYDGTMSTKKSVLIPSSAKRPTWLRANLGWGSDPQDPCMETWGFGNVIDQQVLWNIRVEEIKAALNINIPEVSSPVLKATYDQFGNLINSAGDRIVAAGMKTGWFKLPVQLVSFPSDIGANSTTECYWEIKKSTLKGKSSITGLSGEINISVPKAIGFYDLHLKFIFKNDLNNRIGEQVVVLNLWVSYDQPKITLGKRIWLEKAIDWAKGSKNDDEVALRIMNAIYSKSNWRYINGGNSWFKLIEGTADWGNCRNMANVWTNVLFTLGIGGGSPAGHTGRNKMGFMSPTGLVAFGNLNSSNGNAYPGFVWSYDRWVFGSHWFGKKGDTYYDPVFNITGTDLYYHVAYDIESVSGSTIIAGAAKLYNKGSSFEFDHGNWPKYSYSISSNLAKSTSEKSGEAIFTGFYSENALDVDGDGIFEQLGADVGVQIVKEGIYTVIGSLEKDGSFITARALYTEPSNWREYIGPGAAEYQVKPLFTGEEIFRGMIDGTYSMSFYIIDTSGAIIDSATFNTDNYSHTDFGEYSARITGITESARDTNSDSYYDDLLTTVTFENSKLEIFTLIISMFNLEGSLSTESFNLELPVGNHSQEFPIKTNELFGSGYNGTYYLLVQLMNSDGEFISIKEIETSNYSSNEFNPPQIYFTKGASETGIDIDFDGLFDSLQIIIGIESELDGNFTVMSWLNTEDYEEVSWTEKLISITTGSNSLELNFNGEDINKSKFNGPYKIGYAVIRDTNNIYYSAEDIYTTEFYDFNQFEEAKADLIVSTGTYTEGQIDADSDQLIDTLVIEVGVVPRDSGNVVAIARLVDMDNETILWGSTIEFLSAKVEQKLQLKFDGRYIFGSQKDGPYYLKDLQIYHVGDPSQGIEISEPYMTEMYAFDEFEPSGVIVGTVKDSLLQSIKNVFLIIEGVDNDYSNSEGWYNIVVLDSAEYVLKIEGPDSLKLEWDIYVDSIFTTKGDSVILALDSNQVTAVDFIGPIDITNAEFKIDELRIPKYYSLEQNFPNPFNPTTTIKYKLPNRSFVSLIVYSLLGKKVVTLVNEIQPAGNYLIEFNAVNLPTGIYLYKLKTNYYESTKKMLLIK